MCFPKSTGVDRGRSRVNYAFEVGELSSSQKQAVITFIQKKDRDNMLIKNWRPIFFDKCGH